MPLWVVLDSPILENDPRILLGRIVSDPLNPLDGYRPGRAQSLGPTLKDFYRPPDVQIGFDRVVKGIESEELRAKVAHIINMDISQSKDANYHIASDEIQTYELEQHLDAFAALKKLLFEPGPDPENPSSAPTTSANSADDNKVVLGDYLRTLLQRSKNGKLYWIVGVHVAKNARVDSSSTYESASDATINIPVSEAAVVASGVPVPPLDAKLQHIHHKHREDQGSAQHVGNKIFATKYVVVKYGRQPSRKKGQGFRKALRKDVNAYEVKNFSVKEGKSFAAGETSEETLDTVLDFNDSLDEWFENLIEVE